MLSKKILIAYVKTKPSSGKCQKFENMRTRGSMAPFSHLLWLAYGFYMTTATLLNSHLYTDCYLIALILCIPAPIFRLTTLFSLSCNETFVLKCSLLKIYRLLHIFTLTTDYF